jgi:hypothetical protein
VLIGAGLWISLHYCLTAWKADPDVFTTVVLWRGVREHGLGFLRTWSYTQDNWLLSLLPINAVAFSIAGATPRLLQLSGWLFFIASVAMTGWLAARLAGWRTGALLACVLLFANYHALGHIGFLSYPISHNVSLAWGLGALLLALWGLERRAYGACVAAGIALYVDAVSDPWASAAIGGPLIVAAAALAVTTRSVRRAALALAASAGVAVWAAYKHPFGLLHFLPRGHFQFGGLDGLLQNARLGYRALAVMFNVVPGANLDDPRVQATSLAALVVVLGGAAILTLGRIRQAGPGRGLVAIVTILSIAAVGGLYLLGPANTGLYVGRFFPNLYFLGALLVATTAAQEWRGWRWPAKALLAAYAVLFMASGAAMAPSAWTSPIQPAEPPEAQALGDCLQAHRLAYGYGAYWGSNALAMDSLTGGAVTIRPVVFQGGRVARRPGGTSSLWFQPSAEPADARPFLVVRTDFENCPSADACESAARAQFGEPAERLACADAVVVVWRHGLAALID